MIQLAEARIQVYAMTLDKEGKKTREYWQYGFREGLRLEELWWLIDKNYKSTMHI